MRGCWNVGGLRDKERDDDEISAASETAASRGPNSGALSVHGGAVTALAYSPDGKYLASGSEGTMVIRVRVVWGAPNNAALYSVSPSGESGHADTVSALAFKFSRDNVYLASASDDKLIVIWTVEDGREHKRITAGSADDPLIIDSLAYTPNGKYLSGGAENGTLQLWDARAYEQVQTLHGNTEAVTFMIFSSDGRLMATGGMDRACYIWETTNLLAGEPPVVLQDIAARCALLRSRRSTASISWCMIASID